MESNFKILWPTIEGAVWAAFILGYLSFARWLPRVLAAALAGLGTISYSIYLIHFVVIDICIRQHYLVSLPQIGVDQNARLTAVLILPVVLFISILTYRYIEKPFLQLRHAYIEPR